MINKETIRKAKELYAEIKDLDWEGDLTNQDKWRECVRSVIKEEEKVRENLPKLSNSSKGRIKKIEEMQKRGIEGSDAQLAWAYTVIRGWESWLPREIFKKAWRWIENQKEATFYIDNRGREELIEILKKNKSVNNDFLVISSWETSAQWGRPDPGEEDDREWERA